MLEFTAARGRLDGSRWVPSPNCDARPEGAVVTMLVLHCISLPPGEFGGGEIDALFTNRLDTAAHPYFAALEGLEVSAHFLIDRAGAVTQYVDCDERAWHAGASSYCGVGGCNDFSIGIELEGTEQVPYTDAQYTTLATLVRVLRRRFPELRQGSMVAHSDIAPGRKTDPGPSFDWRRLHRMLAAAAGALG